MLFRRKPSGLASLFGTLELRVLDVLWERGGDATVRDVLPHFPNTAYTTLMTTMDRLHRKGVLERRKVGRAFLYRPMQSREELESRIIVRTLEPLLQGNAEPVLSCLVDQVSRHDEKLLDELERLVRQKRKQQERGR